MNLPPPSSRQLVCEVWSREHLLHEQIIALGSILEPSSLSSYTSAVQSYVTFCCTHDFSIDPTTDTLSFYIVYIRHFIKPKSVSSYLSGICNQLEGCRKIHTFIASQKQPLQWIELTQDFRKVIMHSSFIVNDGQIKFNLPMRKADYTFEGYSTWLASLGVPVELIQAIGRCASEFFQIYIRTHPVLLTALLFSQ
ncbi:hypothetical protein EV368DRAFT_77088 [Lentinula lateritia]|nr:hypothetical protein EV368DRAFT_77088 [Lentinula lateritia]